MPSIANMAELIALFENPAIAVHQERCVLVRNRNADCLRCAQACTSGCISFDKATGELSVQPLQCIGCGTCATACPTGALEAIKPKDIDLLAHCQTVAAETPGLCIACANALNAAGNRVDSGKVMRVTCLGHIDESMLVSLAAKGQTSITLVHSNCDSCSHAPGGAMAVQVIETTSVLLDAWKAEASIKLRDRFPSWSRAEQPDCDQSKRAFLEQGYAEGKRVGKAATQAMVGDALGTQPDAEERQVANRGFAQLKVTADGTMPHAVPQRRRRLLGALRALGQPEDTLIATRLWGNVIVDADACSSCRMCAVFCPTGALRKFEGPEGTLGVEHVPAACVKCRCCENICPEHAISISEEVFAVDLLRGVTERFEMKPMAIKRGSAHSIKDSLKPLMKIDRVYER